MSGLTAGTLAGTDDGVEFKVKRKAAGKAKQTVTIGAKKQPPHVERSSLPLKKVRDTLHSLMTTAWTTSPLWGKFCYGG